MLDHVDEQTMVDTLVALIRVPSVTGTDAESELRYAQATLLEQSGLDVDAWKFDMDALRADPRFPGEPRRAPSRAYSPECASRNA